MSNLRNCDVGLSILRVKGHHFGGLHLGARIGGWYGGGGLVTLGSRVGESRWGVALATYVGHDPQCEHCGY